MERDEGARQSLEGLHESSSLVFLSGLGGAQRDLVRAGSARQGLAWQGFLGPLRGLWRLAEGLRGQLKLAEGRRAREDSLKVDEGRRGLVGG